MKKLIVGSICLIIYPIISAFGDKSVVSLRSQSVDLARQMAGLQQQIHCFDKESDYGTVSLAISYNKTFHADRISQALFGCQKLTFSGSLSSDRTPTDVMADNFALPLDFVSNVCFSPFISNVIFDLDWYMGFDSCLEGLYFQMHAPVVHSNWDLRMREFMINPSSQFDPAGYISAVRVDRAELPDNVTAAFNGVAVGDIQDSLLYGRINGQQVLNRVSDIQLMLGWDFWQRDWFCLGAFIRGTVPTGTRMNGVYLFEPIIGNQRHAGLGGGLYGNVTVWNGCNDTESIMLYGEIVAEHLFNQTEKRSFDFTKNGNGSRYMLLVEQLERDSKDLFFAGTAATVQYSQRLVPAINYTTLSTKIGINAQVEALFAMSYTNGGFIWDAGYNFWFLSKETCKGRESFISDRFSVKGDASVYGFIPITELPVPLSPSQSSATITNQQGAVNSNFINLNVDNATPAQTNTGASVLNNLTAADIAQSPIQFTGPVQTYSSNVPMLLTDMDINTESGLLPKAISHKLFTYVGYVCQEVGKITPYFGGGISGEWACKCFETNSALSQFSVWMRGGISF